MFIHNILCGDISEIPTQDRIDESSQERMFRRIAKIPISETPNGLVGMDFVDYWRKATFRHLVDIFSRYPIFVFVGNKKRMVAPLIKWRMRFSPDGYLFSEHRILLPLIRTRGLRGRMFLAFVEIVTSFYKR